MTTADVQAGFRENFTDARELFVSIAGDLGLQTTSHEHPLAGPDGETLFTDVVAIGDQDAENLVVLISGTHGVETLCGSACQSLYLSNCKWQGLPANTAVLIIHAINPWGAAHIRRNNEDNVDLGRNFMNFQAPLPKNSKYAALRAAIDCPEFRGAERARADKIHADYVAGKSINDYVDAIMGGQYEYPNGFAYGGDAPVWSNRLLRNLLAPYASSARRVRVVEYHSGLGPYGYGAAVTMQVDEDLQRVRSIYGRWVDAPNDASDTHKERFHKVQGTPYDGIRETLVDAELAAIVVEFGTYPPFESLRALLDDHWLTQYGDPKSTVGRGIKQRILEYHYPADPDWRQAIADRSAQIIDQTFRSLQ